MTKAVCLFSPQPRAPVAAELDRLLGGMLSWRLIVSEDNYYQRHQRQRSHSYVALHDGATCTSCFML